MKMLSAFLAFLPVAALAQDGSAPAPAPVPQAPRSADPGYHRHDGFYLSMNVGPAFGGTTLKARGSARNFDELGFSGPGGMVDFKIGGAIRENLILSGDLIGRTITGPTVKLDGDEIGDASDDFSVSDNTIGLGLTYYFMPHNVFISGTIGIAKMSIKNEDTDTEGDSKTGLGVHFKVGKEWWVGKNWGLGVAAGLGFLAAADKEVSGVDYQGDITSRQFYILFNTTFN